MIRSRPVTVICARMNHPTGYGYGNGEAHGYVTLLVTKVRLEELALVRRRLTRPVREPFTQGGDTSWWGTWYGGVFDPVAVVNGPATKISPMVTGMPLVEGKVISVGDNRAVLAITWKDLLLADTTELNGHRFEDYHYAGMGNTERACVVCNWRQDDRCPDTEVPPCTSR